ncbi:peptidase domain-containing ABC transporter [Planomonospora sp. ID82291]|uniref:peptidase domain-containing ABC transporter n=1 Tax=Planomonospora sp. ID82291 TaxID=2738136 RepID=UPI0018C43A2D|nr:peptidase domain-containing ABC transporter [Planomonospora sp. ID82291]MBG0814212.1 peptidase domain-containing ABC transporter [Planomonospora sp. ID82291]
MRRRVPLRMQLTRSDCGAACLAMVLGGLGRRTGLGEVREHLAEGVDGVSLREMIRAGARFGLRLRACRAPMSTVAELPTPFVALWENNHFVVVERATPRAVAVLDPARGRRRLSQRRFRAGYSGTVLLADAPTGLVPPVRSRPWRALRPLIAPVLANRGLIAAVLLASLGVQLLGLAVPLFTKLVVDRPAAADTAALAAAAACVVLTQVLVVWTRARVMIRLQTSVAAEVMRGLVGHTLSLPYRFFQRRSRGDLLSRLSGVAMLRDLLTEQSLSFLLDLFTAVSYLALLTAASPRLALLTLAAAAVQAVVVLATTRRGMHLALAALHTGAATQSTLVDSLAGIEAIKASGGEQAAAARWRAHHDEELTTGAARDRHVAGVQAVSSALGTALHLGLLVTVFAAADTGATLGDRLALVSLAVAATAPLTSLLGIVYQLQLAAAHVGRITDLMGAEPERHGGLRPAGGLRGGITVTGLSTGYDARTPVLRDVSLHIPPGARVAIVGASGSGKTTLGRALVGLVEPSTGRIRFDGVPLEEFDRRWLRRQVGVVTQQPHLFSGTVRANIAGFSELSGQAVEHAARVAEIHDEITRLPQGYDTDVGEGGGRLSGGQRQRLALARALAHRPRILLLDESTASLDAATEERIRRNLLGLGQTQIIIAHRLSTVQDADLIVVLDRGRVVETGTHHELTAHGGHYADLVRHQHRALTPP